MTNNPQSLFRPAAVQPTECLKAGWNLIRDQYWLFFGMTIVALIIGSAVPLGILLGPMMCGLFLTYFKKRRGEPIEFATLFKGFDYFGQAVLAAILHMVPIIVIIVPAYLFLYVGMFVTLAAQGNDGNPAATIGFLVIIALLYLVVILLIIVISIGFTFAYPLIVDRGLPGLEAVKLSFRAAFANFWRLLGLSILSALLGLCGLALCIVGVYLVVPITYAAAAVAYEQVFGLSDSRVASNLPPPPPTFN
jgi:uncharacterized membrane protein